MKPAGKVKLLILRVVLLIRSSALRKALARPLSLGFHRDLELEHSAHIFEPLLEMPSDLIFCTGEMKKIPSTVA
jgi:hypothetical protein